MNEITIPSQYSAFKPWSKNKIKPKSSENIILNIEENNNLSTLTCKKRKREYITPFKKRM